METVSPQYEQQLKELAAVLVTPERFGKIAVAPETQLGQPPTTE